MGSGQMIEPTDTVDYTKPILMALNTLRNESDVLVLYWENRLGVPNDTLPSDGVPIKESENSNSTNSMIYSTMCITLVQDGRRRDEARIGNCR